MTLFQIFFYIIAAVILISTVLAITRRNLVHVVVYLVISFFGSAMLFYLFGAPLLAALEVIIYAGAIMILFLFIIMMIRAEGSEERLFPYRKFLPALGLVMVYLIVCIGIFLEKGATEGDPMPMMTASPKVFGAFLFHHHWMGIEIVSMLLLVALVGALHLGRSRMKRRERMGDES